MRSSVGALPEAITLQLPSPTPSRSRSPSPQPARPKRSSRRLRDPNRSLTSSPMITSGSDSSAYNHNSSQSPSSPAFPPLSPVLHEAASQERLRRDTLIQDSLNKLEAASLRKVPSNQSMKKAASPRPQQMPDCQLHRPHTTTRLPKLAANRITDLAFTLQP